MYAIRNKPQSEMTANPSKYRVKEFKEKPCKECGNVFSPKAPSHLHCSQECADRSLMTAYLLRNYSITLNDYEYMLKIQNNKCSICKTEGFVMDPKRHKVKLVVDHCHSTGEVRGLLCHNCNRALGLLKDNVDVLYNAINYLESATTIRKE